ncbi:MAG: OmpA family protein, partial [Myxococcales bacterium]|nr:OmpA family protein [Myxococcales bacterium]
IHFAFNSATILPDSFPLMQKIADIFNQTPAIKKVAIEGHTDNKGSAVYNKNLSQNRANSVMQWLVQHGVAANRLEAHGYGLEKPIADNATEEGRAANRRVEFHILEEDKK